MTSSPFQLFKEWYLEAQNCGLLEPTSMSLATADKNGRPSVRIVLLKKFDETGFTFFTNYNSRKGRELLENPQAALCFYWMSLKKQVRVEGRVEKVSDNEADEYFNSRHPDSRIGAHASNQSQVLGNRDILLKKVAELKSRLGSKIPRPEYWSGFKIVPDRIEFWQEGEFRLHQRQLFVKQDNTWQSMLLYP